MINIQEFLRSQLTSIEKALTIAGVGDSLAQQVVSPVIPFMAIHKNPLLNAIPSPRWEGRGFYWDTYAEGSTPSTFVADTDDATEDTGTYTRNYKLYKTQITSGKVTRMTQDTGSNFVNALLKEAEHKMRGFRNKMEKQLLVGEADSVSPGGLYEEIPASQRILNSTTSGGAILNETKLNQMLHLAQADNNRYFIVSSDIVQQQLEAIMNTLTGRYDQKSIEVLGGVFVPTYRNVPWYVSTNMPDVCTFDGASTTALTGGTASMVYCCDSSIVTRYTLNQPTFFPLARTTSQYFKFEIFADWLLAVEDYLYTGRLDGILTSSIT